MKKIVTLFLLFFSGKNFSQNFTQGNIVVVRVGDGVSPLSANATPVFLDEYTPMGSFVQSVPLPTAVAGANKSFLLMGTGNQQGMLTRSSDGRYLQLIGYAANPGDVISGVDASVVNRSIARIDDAKNMDITTALSNTGTGAPSSVVSVDGSAFWLDGSGSVAVRHALLGASNASDNISASGLNFKAINIFDNQLYVTSASGGPIGTIGTGIPTTTGQTYTPLPGVPNTGLSFQFFFADLDINVPGVDVLYIANLFSGIEKYSLVAGNWISNGIFGSDADDYAGLTGVVNGTTVTLYATRHITGSTSGGGDLVRIDDASGYNGSILGSTFSLLSTATNNTGFRGVALAPTSFLLPLKLLSFTAFATKNGAKLEWVTTEEMEMDKFIIEKSVDGQIYAEIANVIAKNQTGITNYKYTDVLTQGVSFYRLKMIHQNGNITYSKIVVLNYNETVYINIYPNPAVDNILVKYPASNFVANLTMFTIDGKEIANYVLNPQTTQIPINVSKLPPGGYYFIFNPSKERILVKFTKQ